MVDQSIFSDQAIIRFVLRRTTALMLVMMVVNVWPKSIVALAYIKSVY